MINEALCRAERLRGKRVIANLFDKGKTLFEEPYRVSWMKISKIEDDEDASADIHPSRFAVSVPKRRFKRAVKRNLIKRRTREVFRKNKNLLNSAIKVGEQIHLIVIYNSDNMLTYAELDDAMRKLLQRIANNLKKYVEK